MKKIKSLVTKQSVLFLGVYFLVFGVSFATFSWATSKRDTSIVSPMSQEEPQSKAGIMNFSGPKDQECPVNGEMFTKEQAQVWGKRRPLLVMIENHKNARPQSGLSRADVVYEAIAEGGITRFMGVYYCRAALPAEKPYDVGPVRSARTYFLDWASEYSRYPLYNHVGGAHCSPLPGGGCATYPKAQALEQIDQYGWLDSSNHSDMNQFALSYKQCRREPKRTGESRAVEHTMYCDTDSLWKLADKRGLSGWDKENFTAWKFKDDDSGQVGAGKIGFDFWDGFKNYHVTWSYDAQSSSYSRENGGVAHLDFLTNKPLKAKVVVVQFVKETGPVDPLKHMLYQTVGEGKALVFQDGGVTKGTWEKAKRTARTRFYDSKGKEIKFNRGKIWIEALPRGNKVNYESQ